MVVSYKQKVITVKLKLYCGAIKSERVKKLNVL